MKRFNCLLKIAVFDLTLFSQKLSNYNFIYNHSITNIFFFKIMCLRSLYIKEIYYIYEKIVVLFQI